MQQRGTWRVLGTGQGPEARAPGNAVWPLIPAGVPAGREWEDRNRAGTEATTAVPGGAGAVPVGTLLRAPSSEDMAQSPASCVAQSYVGGCERTHNAPTKQLPVTPGVGTVGAGDRLAATCAARPLCPASPSPPALPGRASRLAPRPQRPRGFGYGEHAGANLRARHRRPATPRGCVCAASHTRSCCDLLLQGPVSPLTVHPAGHCAGRLGKNQEPDAQ